MTQRTSRELCVTSFRRGLDNLSNAAFRPGMIYSGGRKSPRSDCRRANLFWTLSELYMTAVFALDIYFKWVQVWQCGSVGGYREGSVLRWLTMQCSMDAA